MKTNYYLFCLLCLVLSLGKTYAALNSNELIGCWESNIKNSNIVLRFYEDLSGLYIQNTEKPDESILTFTKANIYFHDDILILELFAPNSDYLVNRLVLSGWSTSGTRALFGTRFLYKGKGLVFNGLPVSLRYIGENQLTNPSSGRKRARRC